MTLFKKTPIKEALCYLMKEKNYTSNATEIIINTEYYF